MDFFPTKGIEYLMIIGYLLMLIPLAGLLTKTAPRPRPAAVPRRRRWVDLPEPYLFHQGHTWAAPAEDGTYRIGVDAFAGTLLGTPDGIDLPEPGDRLTQGDEGAALRLDGWALPLLSPIGGEVVETNPALDERPAAVAESSYEDGWLLRVRPDRADADRNNLLSGPLARAWMDRSVAELGDASGGAVGATLADGGEPVPGSLRTIEPERWPEAAGRLLRTRPRPV